MTESLPVHPKDLPTRRDALRLVCPLHPSYYAAVDKSKLSDSDRTVLFCNTYVETAEVPGIESERRPLDQDVDPKAVQVLKESPIRKSLREAGLSLEETEPYRIRVAWRLVRALAYLLGAVETGQKLLDADNGQIDFWTRPCRVDVPQESKWALQAASLFRIFHDAQANSDFGFSLLPPAVGQSFLVDGNIAADYNPDEDGHLCLYVQLLERLAALLGIYKGSLEMPDSGRLGMMGLNDPLLVRLAFPSKLQIMAWECELVSETAELLARHGLTEVRRRLYNHYGLTFKELDELTAMARREILQRSQMDADESKALMLLRLEDYVSRARDSLNLEAEIRGLKQLTTVLGISRMEADDLVGAFVEVARKANQPQLPVIEARRVVSDDDE